MKKAFKVLAAAAGITAGLAIVNHLYYTLANTKDSKKTESHTYRWRFGKINYVVRGDGEPVLLIHGIGVCASHLEWEAQIARLSKTYRVYALDLLGFGSSDRPKISYSAYLYAGLINNFIVDIIREPVRIAASSDGASFATAAFALRPDLYKRMLLISPTGVGADYKPVTFCSSILKGFLNLPVYGTSLYLALGARMQRRQEPAAYMAKRPVAKHAIAAFLGNFLSIDLNRLLFKINVPTTIVWGGENSVNPVSNYRNCTPLNPYLELVVFENSTEQPHQDDPQRFHDFCLNFFSA